MSDATDALNAIELLRAILSQVQTEKRYYMAENAKLRELVAGMYAVISDRNSWWDCTRKDTRRFADRMRELGVEVD